jgi:hypothetical protein
MRSDTGLEKGREIIEQLEVAVELCPTAKAYAALSAAVATYEQDAAKAYSLIADAIARDDAWARKHKEYLATAERELIERTSVVEFVGLDGTNVAFGGRSFTLPAEPLRMNRREYVYTARKDGYHEKEGSIELASAQEKLNVTLSPALDIRAYAAGLEASENDAGGSDDIVATESEPAGSKNDRKKLVGWSLVGAGVAAVAAGAILLSLHQDGTCDTANGGECPERYNTAAGGWAALGGGVAAVAGGSAILLWPSTASSTAEDGEAASTAFNVGFAGTF